MEGYIVSSIMAITLILSVALSMEAIAEQAGAEAITFSENAKNALPCAFAGIELTECVPDIYGSDFHDNIKDFQTTLDELDNQNSTR